MDISKININGITYNLKDNRLGAPTLVAAPTSSTTSYTKDGLTMNFLIGLFCRVADALSNSGYKFYQLCDLRDNGTAAVWQELNDTLVTPSNPSSFLGMNKVTLSENVSTVNGVQVNTLTLDMFYKGDIGSRVPNTNTIFIICYNFTLSESITIPSGCILYFDGGSIDSGNLVLNNTILDGNIKFGTQLIISGSCANLTAYLKWFVNNDIDAWHRFLTNVSGVVTYEYTKGSYLATYLISKSVDEQIIIHGNGTIVSFPHTTSNLKAYDIHPLNTEEIVKTLTAVADKGTNEISVDNLTDISIGDVCTLHDHATSSFTSDRDYEQGEFIFVRDISNNKIIPDHKLYGTYKHLLNTTFVEDGTTKKNGPCTLTKFHIIYVNISDLTITLRGEVGQTRSYGLNIYKAITTLENVKAYDFIFGILLDACINSYVRNCECVSNKIVYDGIDNYGLCITGCLNLTVIGGRYMGGNHGLVMGCHYQGNMSALTRYVTVMNVTASSNKFETGLNCHAGADYISFIGNNTEALSVAGDHITIKDNNVTGLIRLSTNLSYNHIITGNTFNTLTFECRDWPSYLHTYVNYTPYTDREVMVIENNICTYILGKVNLTSVQRSNLTNVEIRINNNIVSKRFSIDMLPTDLATYQNSSTILLSENTMDLNTQVDGGAFINARRIELKNNNIGGILQMELNADIIDIIDNRMDSGKIWICRSNTAPSSCNILHNIISGTIFATPNANSVNSRCLWKIIGNIINNTVSIGCYYSGSTYYDIVQLLENTTDNEQANYLTISNANKILDGYDYSKIDYQVSTTTANSIYSGAIQIDGTKPLHIIPITGEVTSVTLLSGKKPKEGHMCHVILTSVSATTVSIVHDSTNCVCPDGFGSVNVSVPAGGYVEVDFINANNKIYARIV